MKNAFLLLLILILANPLGAEEKFPEPNGGDEAIVKENLHFKDLEKFNEKFECKLVEKTQGSLVVWSSESEKDAQACLDLISAELKTVERLLGNEATWRGQVPVRVVLTGSDKVYMDLIWRLEKSAEMDIIRADLCRKASTFSHSEGTERVIITRMGAYHSRKKTHGMVGDSICGSLIRCFPLGDRDRSVPSWLSKGLASMVSMRHIGRSSFKTVNYKKKNVYNVESDRKPALKQWIKINRSKKQSHDSLKKVINLTSAGFKANHTITAWIALETLYANRSPDGPNPLRELLIKSSSKKSIEKIVTGVAGKELGDIEKDMDKWAGKARFQKNPFVDFNKEKIKTPKSLLTDKKKPDTNTEIKVPPIEKKYDDLPARNKAAFHKFTGNLPPLTRHKNVKYDFDLDNEEFEVFVPTTVESDTPAGLIVFINPGPKEPFPDEWRDVLREHNIMWVAPANAGNDQKTSRRVGLAVLAASCAMKKWNIDPKRVYVGGFSGGARVASMAALYHPEIFKGTLGICGVQFYKKVKWVHGKQEGLYGFFALDQKLIAEAKKRKVRFSIVTGPDDFIYGHIRDVVEQGIKTEGFPLKFMDIKGMGHELCSPAQLEKALGFLEGRTPN